jgi:hypothetical protein
VPDISNVAGGVAWDVEHREFQAERFEDHAIALAQARRLAGQALTGGPEQGHAPVLQKAGNAADVVRVVMREQDAGEGEIFLRQGALDGRGVAGIDRDHLAAIAWGVDQPDVVVGKCPNWRDLQHRIFSSRPRVTRPY